MRQGHPEPGCFSRLLLHPYLIFLSLLLLGPLSPRTGPQLYPLPSWALTAGMFPASDSPRKHTHTHTHTHSYLCAHSSPALTETGAHSRIDTRLLRPHVLPLPFSVSLVLPDSVKPSNYTCLGKCGESWGRERPGRNGDLGTVGRMRVVVAAGRYQLHTHTHSPGAQETGFRVTWTFSWYLLSSPLSPKKSALRPLK